jgi:hypothetical protein
MHNWRVRHPILRAVEPLPPELHICAPDVVMTNYEATQQAEWNRMYGDE